MLHAHVSLSSCERPAKRSTFRLAITSSARTCLRMPRGAFLLPRRTSAAATLTRKRLRPRTVERTATRTSKRSEATNLSCSREGPSKPCQPMQDHRR
eukprot:9585277-Alexandrium_andersonii.AAC.1